MITIGVGPEADGVYLQELAQGSGGIALDVETVDHVISIYEQLGAELHGASANGLNSGGIPPLGENFTVNVSTRTDELTNSVNASPLNMLTSGLNIAPATNTIALDSPLLDPNGEVPVIPPVVDLLSSLSLPRTDDSLVVAPAPSELTVASPDSAAPALDTTDLSAALTSNIVPINIEMPEDSDVQYAELAVNGYRLHTFTEGPFVYDLDTSTLAAGNYNLTFTVMNSENVVSTGTLEFEVMVVDRQLRIGEADIPVLADSTTGEAGGTLVNTAAVSTGARDIEAVGAAASEATLASAAAAPRVLLISGQQVPFNLTFTTEQGLSPILPETAATVVQPNVLDILAQPATLIPEPVREALVAPRPEFWTAVIFIMSLSLLPQGLFTLYWMMYTWNNPATADQYRSPREFVTPQYSFTALVPARHEERVIKDTILAVDRIDYPEHLKEILVLIRDEDDDATIAKAREAIDELGKDNIRLVTFNTGPRNKPNGLNKGLKVATKDVVCVFDAEDEPHEELYQVINTVMLRDQADVVQSGVQLMNFQSTWFSALNCLEYFFWFKSGLHAFTHKFHVTPLGGNTVFFKREWLEKINGWDDKCLTEDADVGIRLTLKGAKIQIVYDEKHVTQEETPDTVDSFIRQRTRWCQGFYEIFFKGDWRRLPEMRQRLTALYILLNSLLQAAVVLYLPVGLYVALTQRISVPVALVSYLPIFLLLMQLVTNLVGIREFTSAYDMPLPFLFRVKLALVYYPYQLLLMISAFRAVTRLLARKNAWEKTAHSNLHRQGQVA